MKQIRWAWVPLVCCLLLNSNLASAAERFKYRVKSASSEYEAMKIAYKDILGQALKAQVGNNAGSFDDALRHTINRKVEEEFVKTKQQFIQSSSESCSRSRVDVECVVIASVKMEELAAWLNKNMGDSGSQGNRLKDAKFGIMVNVSDEANNPYVKDFVTWLHSQLEQTFGNDVYLIEKYLDPDILRNQCAGFDDGYKKYSKMGASYDNTSALYKRNYDDCMTIVKYDLDAILVLDSLGAVVEEYDGQKVAGAFTPRISFLQTRTKRNLSAPKPKQITQYGYGSKLSAEADFRNNIYQTTTAYIAQQFNDIVITAMGKGRLASEQSNFNYTVTITGVNTDDLVGKKKLRFLRNWFKDTMSVNLIRDFQRSSYSEKVSHITSDAALDLSLVEDDLPLDLEDAGFPVRVDITKSGNIIISFKGEEITGRQKAIVLLNHAKLAKWIKVESTEVKIRREDNSGTPIALYEASVTISNSSKKNLLIAADPVWSDAKGLEQKTPFSDEKYFLLRGKSSLSVTYRAPNRAAEYVLLELVCPAERCDIKSK